jgi:2-polyprenyl-3-methyl-5-hydroxy-6-metoxy-1,4-benzoquinol methylase
MVRVRYSCLVDEAPRFQRQALIFAETLHKNAGVPYDHVYLHVTAPGLNVVKALAPLGVHEVPIGRFGDGKYCNKILQLDSADRIDGDYVFLCDTDLAFVSPIEGSVVDDPESVRGHPVDFPRPPLQLLKSALESVGAPLPPTVTSNLAGEPTLMGNLNGGLYGIPISAFGDLGKAWKHWAMKLLESEDALSTLGKFGMHVDQMAFCVARYELDLPLQLLGLEYNCPTHVRLPLGGREVTDWPKVLHYHDHVDRNGFLLRTGVGMVDIAVEKVNRSIRGLDDHPATTMLPAESLSSHAGSDAGGPAGRPDVYDRAFMAALLRTVGIERAESVLEFGCGDTSHLDGLEINRYLGLDRRGDRIEEAQRRVPTQSVRNEGIDALKEETAELVICRDVFGSARDEGVTAKELLLALGRAATRRLVVVGPNRPWSMLEFGSERLGGLQFILEGSGLFKRTLKVGSVGGMDVILAEVDDLPRLGRRGAANDMADETLGLSIASSSFPARLYECASASRAIFGWYTSHLPRVFEYPWILERLGFELAGKRIGDLGAGVCSLPFLLANRGAKVVTVDSHEDVVSEDALEAANEWGYFDYSRLNANIESLNESVGPKTFADASFDCWYSVSVVEHMPARVRRRVLTAVSRSLKAGGRLLLTLDLNKGSRDLWNLCQGRWVDSPGLHGTVQDIVAELEERDFAICSLEYLPLPSGERTDLCFIEAIRTGSVLEEGKWPAGSRSWRYGATSVYDSTGMRALADRFFPLGSRRRERLKSVLSRVAGRSAKR